MGRWSYSNRTEADGLKKIEVSFLNKSGYFDTGSKYGTIKFSKNGTPTGSISIQSFISDTDQYIKFNYIQTDNQTGEKKEFDYKIPLTTSLCYFGGKRYWFICPCYTNNFYCGRRVGTLYKNGNYFACRHCYNLTYNSRKLSGISKIAGQVISMPELDSLKEQIKRKYYKGKITRKYLRYLKKLRKSDRQIRIITRVYGEM